MLLLIIVSTGCVMGVWYKVIEEGACTKSGLTEAIHTWWQELLTAILALIIAGGQFKPPNKPDEK